MDEVAEFLKTWELPDLIPKFAEQAIDIQALSALTPDDIKEIIPKTGPRVLFMRCWRTWKIEFSCMNNLSLSNLDFSDLEFRQDPKDADIIVVEENKNVPTTSVADIIIVEEKENVPTNTDEVKLNKRTQSGSLENILLKSLETSSLLIYKGGTLDGDATRNLLASTVAREILNEHTNSPIVGPIYFKWANLIKELFPGERATTYYIPACTTASGAILQARGKLVHQVLNKRRRLQQLGALTSKGKRSRQESPAPLSSSSPRPFPIISDSNTDENIEDDLLWLRNSSDPWGLVETKWKKTCKYRITCLHNNHDDQTLESYMNEYPALKKPQGYNLLNIDFEAAYGDFTHNLFIYFPVAKIRILELLRKSKSKDITGQELICLADSPKEEDKSLAAFLSIPLLLNTTTVKQKKKQKKGESSCSWKPSKVEMRDAFIKHKRSDAEIGQCIELRLKTLQNKGATSQPYIIIVGESLIDIKTCLVVVNKLVIYHRVRVLEKYGPIVSLWSMRFEAKHRIFKKAANASCNRRNITLTLAMKHQLELNDFFFKGKLPDTLKTGPASRVTLAEFSNEQFIRSSLLLCQNKSLVEVSWATVSTTRYVKGAILVYTTSPDNSLPDFFKLQNVFLYDSNSLILMGHLLQTLEFDEHFFAYEVREPEAKENVVKFHNKLLSPIPCNINILSNGKKYVTLRCAL